jgi:hypothetical protein
MRRPLLLLWLAVPLGATAQHDSMVSACAECHAQARSQPATSMGHAMETVEKCEILIRRPILTVTVGRYSYRIERKGSQSSYSVTDGDKTVTMPIRWVMGASTGIGQTYILENSGEFYESRVSYFRELNGLALTLGYYGTTPADLTEAAGRLLSRDEKLRCFGCHATGATLGRQLTLDTMIPGVRCGHCHESIETHLDATLVNGSSQPQSPNELSKLDNLSAEQAANFCGQCHRTWEEIAKQKHPGIENIRFQPYRLTNSKCYDPDDARISCLACHDPHQQVSSKPIDYDEKCRACHGGGKYGAKSCRQSTNKCVTCHMPAIELPGAHFNFSDHWIRIVKPNEKYPG